MVELNNLLVSQSSTIKEAMRIIDKAGLRVALVVNEENKLLGIVTDGDIRRGILKGISVSDEISIVMNNDPITITHKDDFTDLSSQEVFNLLKARKLLGAPILNRDGKIIDFAVIGTNGISFLSKRTIKIKKVKKVLVIGGAGYIGSILVRKLLNKGYQVKVLDSFIYGRDSLVGICNLDLEIIKGDTRHVETLTTCMQGVDAVVHLAELVGDPACALDPKITQDINYLATQLVASVAKHYQINRFIYASSCSVYGASSGENLLKEDSPVNPVSLYAKMKLNCENALRNLSDENFSPTILRLSTVFGLSARPRFDLVVNILTAKAIKESKITIFGGNQWRPNVHVGDVGKTILAVLESPIEYVASEIFNVGSNENNYTISEIGEIVKQVVPTSEVVIQNTDTDQRDYKVDFSKLSQVLNLKLTKSIADGVIEIKKALEENQILDYNNYKYSNIKFLQQEILLKEDKNGSDE